MIIIVGNTTRRRTRIRRSSSGPYRRGAVAASAYERIMAATNNNNNASSATTAVPVELGSRALAVVGEKPDLLFAVLKAKPKFLRQAGRAGEEGATGCVSGHN